MYTVSEQALPASALVLDIRGFTAEMSVTLDDLQGRARLVELLGRMNGVVVRSVERAVQPALRGTIEDLVHLGSTGDGAIAIFLHPEHHARQAMLATLLIRAEMDRVCEAYARDTGRPMSFGIGAESGRVAHVEAREPLVLGTYVGECINRAARAEALTKEIHRTEVIFCSGIVEILSSALLEADYPELLRDASIPAGSISDAEYLELERRMVEVNRRLCINYLHMHVLRGIADPIPLFRLSKSSAVRDNPRFEDLLALLTAGESDWLAEIRQGL